MDCTYCILQVYLNNPYQNFFVNETALFSELDQEITAQKGFMRIGTGEFTDSMALDRITGMSRKLIGFFADKDNCVLELKTKSAFVDNLKDIDHRGRTIMAWSLNSEQIVAQEEFRAAAIDDRLAAASACSGMGYPWRFISTRLSFILDGSRGMRRQSRSSLKRCRPPRSDGYRWGASDIFQS